MIEFDEKEDGWGSRFLKMHAGSNGVNSLVLDTNNILDLRHTIVRLSIKTRGVLPLCDTALFEYV